jgi:hypothetical protein
LVVSGIEISSGLNAPKKPNPKAIKKETLFTGPSGLAHHPCPLPQEAMSQLEKRAVIPGNPAAILFMICAPWMPAFAGITNYDPAPKRKGSFRMKTN